MSLESVATEKPLWRRLSLVAGSFLAITASAFSPTAPHSPSTPTAHSVRSMDAATAAAVLNSSLSNTYRAPKTTPLRAETPLVVLHTTEALGCSENAQYLRGARRNKRGKRVWTLPKANILICADSVYMLTDLDRYANHAGVSMFNGREDISKIAIGVEIEGTWRKPLTDKQYELACATVTMLKERYNLNDSAFVSHAQVAYSEKGWHAQRMRGRRRDGTNFDWARMCINHRTDDPDVDARALSADPHLQYTHFLESKGVGPQERIDSVYGLPTEPVAGYRFGEVKNSITPWTIAADAFNEKQTVYFLPPNGRRVRGSEIEKCSKNPKCTGVNWYNVPWGTMVFPYVEERHVNKLTKEVRKQYFN